MTNDIEITDLSKKYQICHDPQAMYSTLRETLAFNAKKALMRLRAPFSSSKNPRVYEEFWALKDVNLTVKKGDRVGIIGRNGAGKSTLLKILSKIISPTTGHLKMRGRVASLLEVGTGFHPELTGKENIFLNGAILGMKRHEISTKFDAIVNFAEVDKFLDTPVKRYSSGMIARLGFAIAAHLDPDILIIDEVLAVGDAAFQEKCLKTLNELGGAGRTVLFVSHDINAVMNLCNRGVYLDKGKVVAAGPIDACVDAYMRHVQTISTQWQGNLGDDHIRFTKMRIMSDQHSKEFFYQNESAIIEIEYEIFKPSKEITISIGVWNQRNQLLAHSGHFESSEAVAQFFQKGKRRISFMLDARLFHEGEYFIKLECGGYHNRRVICDDIILKFPVYSQSATINSCRTNPRTGISLGNRWTLM
ncbi:MAG: ATP-binding cassette domain-containing protein [Parachlamydiaceae bacterium]|nr:ATP-binding cassette domain-containing protein [Parachlamydiaceae bacterium]